MALFEGCNSGFSAQINATIVEPIHPSTPLNKSPGLLSQKDLYSQIGGTPGIGSELVFIQATPNGFGFFGSPFRNPPSLFSPNKKNRNNALYKYNKVCVIHLFQYVDYHS